MKKNVFSHREGLEILINVEPEIDQKKREENDSSILSILRIYEITLKPETATNRESSKKIKDWGLQKKLISVSEI